MPVFYEDLRDWISQLEAKGEVKTLKGVHWDKEMGAITDLLHRQKYDKAPALLFDEVPGYPAGYRCIYGMINSPARLALSLGMDIEGVKTRTDFLHRYRNYTKEKKYIPPKYVETGPVMENVITGDDINILKFPVPIHHQKDGGRFVGTGDCVITKDPDSDWINLGVYRNMVVDEKTLISYISPGKHGRIHRDKWFEQGKPCPMVLVFGQDPLLWALAGVPIPNGVSELDYAGGLRGKPVEVIKGPVTGLPIPANAEIVVEGYAIPDERVMEQRFGEWSGYYCSTPAKEPLFKIEAIYHRNNPILHCAASAKPPHAHLFPRCVMRSALLWDALERADLPEIKGVWCHESGGGNCFTVVAIKQRFYGHSRMVGHTAQHVLCGAYCNRFTIVVDEDIDPASMFEVLWAMSTRCNPEIDIEIMRKGWSSKIDPMTFGDQYYNSRAFIDACRPFEHIKDFPEVVETTGELKELVLSKWAYLFED